MHHGQDMTLPITVGGDYLWWAQTWHMQTPLETLGAGSFVAFELRAKVRRQRFCEPITAQKNETRSNRNVIIKGDPCNGIPSRVLFFVPRTFYTAVFGLKELDFPGDKKSVLARGHNNQNPLGNQNSGMPLCSGNHILVLSIRSAR